MPWRLEGGQALADCRVEIRQPFGNFGQVTGGGLHAGRDMAGRKQVGVAVEQLEARHHAGHGQVGVAKQPLPGGELARHIRRVTEAGQVDHPHRPVVRLAIGPPQDPQTEVRAGYGCHAPRQGNHDPQYSRTDQGCAYRLPGVLHAGPLRHGHNSDAPRPQVRVAVLDPGQFAVSRRRDAELPARIRSQFGFRPTRRAERRLAHDGRGLAQVPTELVVQERVAGVHLVCRAVRVVAQVESCGACVALVNLLACQPYPVAEPVRHGQQRRRRAAGWVEHDRQVFGRVYEGL